MTDNTQPGSDNDVTTKHSPTEVEADKIKGTQAEQSAKIAHTTQAEHMNNSSQSTPYAQGSAQVELDEKIGNIIDDLVNTDLSARFHNTDWAEYRIKQTVLDWHNKQTLELLDRLESQSRRADDCTDDTLVVKMIRVEAERAKLKERDDEWIRDADQTL